MTQVAAAVMHEEMAVPVRAGDRGLVFEPPAEFGPRIALVDSGGDTSYARLVELSTAVAAFLLDTTALDPARPEAALTDLSESRVAYLEPPGARHVALQWGIWRAGGVSVPLALSYPARELEHVLDDASPAMVIAAASLADPVRDLAAVRDIPFATTELMLGVAAGGRASTEAAPESPGQAPATGRAAPDSETRRALMVYTSGTTGRPKGVVTTHGCVHAQILTLVEAWGWRADDRVLHTLPMHHVHGIINVLSCALWSGACCEFLPRFEPGAVWDRIASGSITVFMAVPTMYNRLIAEWESASPEQRDSWSRGASRLRLMVSGSAALPVRTLERWREITGHTLLERYGMTEIGMALSNPLDGERRAGTVGLPLPGVEVRLVDDEDRVVGPGSGGQLETRGPQVFQEYWQLEDETRAAFHNGWFRTGDEAIVEDGYYRILGRRSTDIIKSGGYKLSALEIESALCEHEAVRDCAVVGLSDDDLGERVCAAITLRPNADLGTSELIEWAGTRLAKYKVPRAVMIIDDLPRNAMGKVVKPAIRELFAD